MDDNELDDRLKKIEINLIEQEHRPIHVIRNYVFRKKKWDDEERRGATQTAIIWRLFFSPGTIAFTGGIVAFITMLILIYQNALIADQNLLIEQQNDFFRQQILSNEINTNRQTLESRNSEAKKVDALKKLLNNYRLLNLPDTSYRVQLNGESLGNCDLSNEPNLFKNIDFIGAELYGVNFDNSNLSGCDFTNAYFMSNPDVYSYTSFRNCSFVNSIFSETSLIGVDFSGSDFTDIQFDWKSQKELVAFAVFINVKNPPDQFMEIAARNSAITSLEQLEFKIKSLEKDSIAQALKEESFSELTPEEFFSGSSTGVDPNLLPHLRRIYYELLND